MRKLGLGLAAVAAIAATAPAGAAVISSNYTVSGGTSGSFSLDFDDATSLYTLTALSLTVPGGSTTFNTSNSALQFALGPTLVLGGNVNGVDNILTGANDDFFVNFDATLNSQSATLSYYVANTQTVPFTTVTITRGSPTAPVPEPATWAMMLVGFAGIGIALRRRSRSLVPA